VALVSAETENVVSATLTENSVFGWSLKEMDGFDIGYKHKCYRGNIKRSQSKAYHL